IRMLRRTVAPDEGNGNFFVAISCILPTIPFIHASSFHIHTVVFFCSYVCGFSTPLTMRNEHAIARTNF
ncbi:hypothetical protein BKA83DRAFT_4244318, partial [Pisolithus microcarpus]